MIFLNKTILFVLFFTGINFAVSAQDAPKTIYQLYDLQKGDCGYGLDENIEKKISIEIPKRDVISPKRIIEKRDVSTLKEVNAALKVFRKALKKRKDISITDTKMGSNGNYCFLKRGKWGFKNAQDEVILNPQFDFIQLDTVAGGFVGFQQTFCNYYDGETGEQKFEEDYYYLKAEGKETFIIQSRNGFGLIHNGKVIINPTALYVKREKQKGISYYLVNQGDSRSYLLLDDYRTKISIKNILSNVFITKDFLLLEDGFLNLKTQRKLVCEEGFSIQLVDEEQQILSIRNGYSQPVYLIDFNGNMISNQAFSAIGKSNNGVSVVSITETTAQNKKVEKQGLINMQGNWIVQPNQYKSIISHGKYYIVKNFDGKKGIIDTKGKIALPVTYGFVEAVRDNHFLCGFEHKSSVDSKIVAMPTGEVIKDSLSYVNLRVSKSCDGAYFIAYLKVGQQIIDENYNVITPIYDYVSFDKQYLMGKINNQIKTNKDNEFELYTCDGKRIYFEIEGEKLGTFNAVKELSKELTYAYLGHQIGYLIPRNGKAISFNHHIRTHQEINFGKFIKLGTFDKNTQGLIDEKGEIVLPFIFKKIKAMPEGTQWIPFTAGNNREGLFSTKGKLFSGKLFDGIAYMGLGLYKVEENNGNNKMLGVMNRNGEEVLPMSYDMIYSTGGLIFAKRGNAHEVFDRTGKQIK